jgi:phenylpropionate dioxygenase-like ring-hydroxylating dioxygenase large terminal subunit
MSGTPSRQSSICWPELPVRIRYGCAFTTLGHPTRDIVEIAEAAEPDRRFLLCGWVTLRASGLRIVENFLDMAHFPFVHTDILGAEPQTQVPDYRSEIRREVDEVWATNCSFFQSRIAVTESAGDFVRLNYRVPTPFTVMLYRVCPSAPDRLDAIALFIQPMAPDLCRAQPVMYLVDNQTSQQELLRFEQVIFAQDLLIVQNQRPLLMPLDAGAEIPTRADSSSIAYRRWLKEKGLVFGTTRSHEA